MTPHPPLKPGGAIGILGTGQLGRMLSLAGAQLGFRTHVFGPGENSPASEVSACATVADYADEKALAAFARSVDVVTYEFENVPRETARFLSETVPVRPPVRALETAQDRLGEKTFVRDCGLGVADFHSIGSLDDLQAAVRDFGGDGVVKTRRFGYDGKGQWRVGETGGLAAVMDELGGRPAICEAFVPFDGEVSVVAARSAAGRTSAFDMVDNVHENHILRHSFAPSRWPDRLQKEAAEMARRVLGELDYVGVLTLEMFVCRGSLIINEMAPRVHNSGHWTIDACATDQFEQHMRAVAGWPLGSPERHCDAVMTNLLGDEIRHIPALSDEERTKTHFYGKREAKPGRKMGHVTRLFEIGARPDAEGYGLF